jgi:hypothetical protein
LEWNPTCFGQFLCPSSGVFDCTHGNDICHSFTDSCLQICMTYTIAVCTVKNSWWWTEELFETCRVSFRNKFEKLVHLVGFNIRNLSWCTVTWTSNFYITNIQLSTINTSAHLLPKSTCVGFSTQPSFVTQSKHSCVDGILLSTCNYINMTGCLLWHSLQFYTFSYLCFQTIMPNSVPNT